MLTTIWFWPTRFYEVFLIECFHRTHIFMPVTAASDPKRAIGRAPERLSLEERLALAGKLIALEIYTPEALPLRRIEAIGDSVQECVNQLVERGHDPTQFEFSRLPAPY
jgi:hypothetical protein